MTICYSYLQNSPYKGLCPKLSTNIYDGQLRTFSNYNHPLSSIMYDNTNII